MCEKWSTAVEDLQGQIHSKKWYELNNQSFDFNALIIIFSIWLILIHIFEYLIPNHPLMIPSPDLILLSGANHDQ